MRVLMLAQFYSPVVGGEERHVQDLSRELVKRGHDVAVATFYLPGVAEFEVDQGVRVYRIRSTVQRASWLYSQAERSHAPPLPDAEVVWALRRIVAREKPDIVHAHNWILHSFIPLKTWSSVPLVMSLHDYSLRCAQKRLMFSGALCSGPGFTKCLYCAADYYGNVRGSAVALSHRLMNPVVRAAVDIFLPVSEATAIGNGLVENQLPFKIIPNFVPDDPGQTQDDVDAYVSRLPQDNYLLFVGDLSRDKGVDVLLRAYADLKNVPPLVLIGRKRPDTPAKLPNNVILMGCWPHSAVMQAWRRSSLALVPSVCPETFGIVAIEAMAMGRPVIASRIGGLTDIIIDGETGFLIAPDDSVALRRAIKRLTDNTALRKRMGQGARRRAFDFRASAVVPCIEEVYRQLTQTAAITEEVDKHGYGVLP